MSVMKCLMRRHERRRGAKGQEKLPLKMLSPEISMNGWAESVGKLAGNSLWCVRERVPQDAPGSKVASSLTQRLSSNRGDPAVGTREGATLEQV